MINMEALYNFNGLTVLTDASNVRWWNRAQNEEEIKDHPYALQLIIRQQIEQYPTK